MTRLQDELERQANELLFGKRGAAITLQKRALGAGVKPHKSLKVKFGQCKICGAPTATGGAGRCRPCYRQGAKSVTDERQRSLYLLHDLSKPGVGTEFAADDGTAMLVSIDERDPLTILLEREEEQF